MTEIRNRVGRPATGSDPTVTIRLPKELIKKIADTAEYANQSKSDVYRRALTVGLQFLSGDTKYEYQYHNHIRPKHGAQVHEAGHAVAAILCAELARRDPSAVVEEAKLHIKGGYVQRDIEEETPNEAMLIAVAGAVAQAKDEGRSFNEVWGDYGASSDKAKAEAINERSPKVTVKKAVKTVQQWFSEPVTWGALVALARDMPVQGKMKGKDCWQSYAYHRSCWAEWEDALM
jgi:hypothetical protein